MTITDPNPDIEPWSFDGGPTLPSHYLSPGEMARTGHLFKGCPNPVEPKSDKKGDVAPCTVCLLVKKACDEEVGIWRAIQEQKSRTWREHPSAAPTVKVEPADEPTAEVELPPPPPIGAPLATDKQVALMVRLAAEKTPEWFNGVGHAEVERRARARSRKDASAAIDKLMAMPSIRPEKQMVRGKIEPGYYALPTVAESENDIAFYRVDVPESGKWAGYTFVKRVIGGRADENVPRNQSAGILARIKDDEYIVGEREVTDDDGQTGMLPSRNLIGPAASRMRYSDNAVRCSDCNTKLTNLASRQRGIGPVCATK